MTPSPIPNLSISIVCKDNEATIRRTAEAASQLAAEVIAVDSGSSDNTIPILEAHSIRVIHEPWRGFVAQKQFALELCSNPWVLHLDSDESPTPNLAESIRALLADPPANIGAAEVNRKIIWAGSDHNGKPREGTPLHHAWQPEWRLRLVRRDAAKWIGYDPHDQLTCTDPNLQAIKLEGDLRHDALPDLTTFLKRQVAHAHTAALSYKRMNRKPSTAKLITSPAGAFLKQLIIRRAYKDGWRGWAAASATAIAAAMKHAILIEQSHEPDNIDNKQ